jgi:hypothetical protein
LNGELALIRASYSYDVSRKIFVFVLIVGPVVVMTFLSRVGDYVIVKWSCFVSIADAVYYISELSSDEPFTLNFFVLKVDVIGTLSDNNVAF